MNPDRMKAYITLWSREDLSDELKKMRNLFWL